MNSLAWISFHCCRVYLWLISRQVWRNPHFTKKCYIIWIKKHISRSDAKFLSLKVNGNHEWIHCYYTESLLALTGVLSGVLFVNFTVKRLFNHKLLNLKMHKLIQRQKCSEIPVKKKVTFTESHQKPEFCSFSERFLFNHLISLYLYIL